MTLGHAYLLRLFNVIHYKKIFAGPLIHTSRILKI